MKRKAQREEEISYDKNDSSYASKRRRAGETQIIKRKFDQYLENDLFKGDMRNMFYNWDMEKVMRDVSKWNSPVRWLQLYIIANACEYRTLHAWVGCNSDVQTRVSQHNGDIPGGPAATRKAAKHWKLIMYVDIPPIRNYSTKHIKKMCKRGRGWASRCKRALSIASNKGLSWKISRSVFDPQTPFVSESIIDFMSKRNMLNLGEDMYLD